MDSGSIYGSSVLPPLIGRRRSSSTDSASTVSPPCGACKFLRRKCTSGCVFAPHFQSDQGAARFAAVHKVFGASNISKLLSHLPLVRRHDAVATICYEAQARLADPVFGCVSTVLLLQRQVAALQSELAVVQTYLMNTQLALSIAYQQQQTANINATVNDLNTTSTGILNPPPCSNNLHHPHISEVLEEISTTVFSAGPPPTSSFDFSMNGFPPLSSGAGGAMRMPVAMYDGVEDISNPVSFEDEMFD